jgi:hypothetical protein
MHPVKMSIEDLQSRGNDVRQMLIPIAAGKQGGPAWQPCSGSSEFVIGVHDGSPSGSDYRSWTFATVRADMRAQYFERWLKFEERGRELWYLERAYLNIFKVDLASRELIEFLCLHCDPVATADETLKETSPEKYTKLLKQAYYKKHPHLHVSTADAPFPHAHIALQVGYIDQILASVDSLSEAIRHAVQMIRDEVFDAMSV